MKSKRILIIGQGLAGSLLAWELSKTNTELVIVDNNHHQCASMVAAGLINPILGKRLKLTWNFSAFKESADHMYAELNQAFNRSFFISRPIQRLFITEEQKLYFESQREYWLKEGIIDSSNPQEKLFINSEFGKMTVLQGGYGLIPEILQSLKEYFEKKYGIIQEKIDYHDIHLSKNQATWKGEHFSHIIFCEGANILNNSWFNHLPFHPAKGEILHGTLPEDIRLQSILNKGQWLIQKDDLSCLTGATFQWDDLDDHITQQGLAELTNGISRIIDEKFIVTKQLAGVRLAMIDQRPIIGPHPDFPSCLIFNGFGSKGTLTIPYCARQMIDFIFNQRMIEKNLQIDRFSAGKTG